jgi:hypothetical protein
MTSDWAEAKARKFWNGPDRYANLNPVASLAALLDSVREEAYNQRTSEEIVSRCVCADAESPRPGCNCVHCTIRRDRADTLAEVRRIVEEEWTTQSALRRGDESRKRILKRLEGLK